LSEGNAPLTTPSSTLDCQRGCLIGVAVGDALGAAIEFRAPGTFKPVTGYRSGGPHGLAPGEWTDDTSMALALADSITCAGWDLNDQVKRYVTWWRQGEYSVNRTCFDIGITTRNDLVRFLDCGDVRRSGDSSERASGNGSIMRLSRTFQGIGAVKRDAFDKANGDSPFLVQTVQYQDVVVADMDHSPHVHGEREELLRFLRDNLLGPLAKVL